MCFISSFKEQQQKIKRSRSKHKNELTVRKMKQQTMSFDRTEIIRVEDLQFTVRIV